MAESESSEWQRNDRKAKNFECPCGKSYLSYPALYTHIKQAHGGKAPGQIKRPDSHTRGRPKTSGNTRIEQHNKSIEDALKSDPIPALVELLATAETCKNRQINQIYENQPVFKLIMNDKDKQFSPKFLKQDKIFDVKMGQGIIQFFKQIQGKIQNKNAYDEIVMIIVLLTEHIIEETQDQNVLNLGTIGLMPEFVNYFIIHDFKKPVQRLKLENLWIFQDQNSIKVFNLFFKWMLYKKFTLTKVQINQKYLNPNQNDEQNQQIKDDQNDNDRDENDQNDQNDQNEENDQSNEEDEKVNIEGDEEEQQNNNDEKQKDEEIQEYEISQNGSKKVKNNEMVDAENAISA